MRTFQKEIIVIGAGISGLAALHFLKKKYAKDPNVRIRLLEKNIRPGGTIRTITHPLGLFECGPNGFLDSKETTLELIRDLEFQSSLVTANPQAKKRFLSIGNRLHEIPTGLKSLFRFKPLSFFDKLRLPWELAVSRGRNPQESVYEFGKRRFGENFAKFFLDPIVKGIYAGDAQKTHLKSAFPSIFELEQNYGSVLKGFLRSRRAAGKRTALGAGRLLSFTQGMASLTGKLFETYKDSISLGEEVQSIAQREGRFVIHLSQRVDSADEIFLCVPAYSASVLLKNFSPVLVEALNKIPYVPVAVVGLVYRRDSFGHLPRGFGYLIPSSEARAALGVVFDSQIFPERTPAGHELFRVMIGGANYPKMIEKTEEELIAKAREEISFFLSLRQGRVPVHTFTAVWPRAIPQYNVGEIAGRAAIVSEAAKIKNLHIVSNFLNGVSLNDCIAAAKTAVYP